MSRKRCAWFPPVYELLNAMMCETRRKGNAGLPCCNDQSYREKELHEQLIVLQERLYKCGEGLLKSRYYRRVVGNVSFGEEG
jgi:hypothetical protein